jgi:hypothetical protein
MTRRDFVKPAFSLRKLRENTCTIASGDYSTPVSQRMDVAHGRYVDYFEKECGKANALAKLIEAVPSCLWVIRGLDVATDELGIPTWF